MAGVERHFAGHFFNEFVVHVPHARAVRQRLKERGLLAGIVLEDWYPELTDCLLLCTTELHDREAIDRLARELSAALDATIHNPQSTIHNPNPPLPTPRQDAR